MFNGIKPEEWLTDSGLTPRGQQARDAYEKYITHLHSMPVPLFQSSRSLHLLQSVAQTVGEDGFALPPHTINFCVNNRCNLKCSYCDLSHGETEDDLNNSMKMKYNVIDTETKHELPLDVCKKIIDSVSWYKPTIRIAWTEALLYSQLIPFIEYTKEKKLPFSMITNGLLLPKFAQQLFDLRVDALRVSLDGPAHIHDSLCGVKGTFDQVVKGLKAMIDLRKKSDHDIQLGCYFTLTDQNYEHMADFIDTLNDLGLLDDIFVGFFMFTFVSQKMADMHNKEHAEVSGATIEETGRQYNDLQKIKPEVILEQKKYIEDKYISKGCRINFRPDFTLSNFEMALSDEPLCHPNSSCKTHWHAIYINPDGHLKGHPQCILPPAGNVFEQPFLDAWNGDLLRKQRINLQKHNFYHGCAKCWPVFSSWEDKQGSWKANK